MRNRVLWIWCPGHEQYEIAALERHVGSLEFERMCKMLWRTDTAYLIRRETRGFDAFFHFWTHE